MATYLMNALPNAFLPNEGQHLKVIGITANQAKALLKDGFESAIGHSATADVLSRVLEMPVKANRVTLQYSKSDTFIISAFTMPRRLNEGETLSEEEIINLPIKWVALLPNN